MRVQHPVEAGYKTRYLRDLGQGACFLDCWTPEALRNRPKLFVVVHVSTDICKPLDGTVEVFNFETGVVTRRAGDQMITPVEVAPLTYTLYPKD